MPHHVSSFAPLASLLLLFSLACEEDPAPPLTGVDSGPRPDAGIMADAAVVDGGADGGGTTDASVKQATGRQCQVAHDFRFHASTCLSGQPDVLRVLFNQVRSRGR